MTKADLIEEVSRIVEVTRPEVEVIVETILQSMVQALQAGEMVELRGFGSFRTRQRPGRIGRNPKTGEKVEVPAKTIPFFKPSKELRDLVKQAAPASPAQLHSFTITFTPDLSADEIKAVLTALADYYRACDQYRTHVDPMLARPVATRKDLDAHLFWKYIGFRLVNFPD